MQVKSQKQISEQVRDASYDQTLHTLKSAQRPVYEVFLSTDAAHTSFDIARKLGKPINEVTGRVNELVKLKLIEPVGKIKHIETGRTRTVYKRVGVSFNNDTPSFMDFSEEEREWYNTMEAAR